MVVAASDGNLAILDLRKNNSSLARIEAPSSLRCCQSDGLTAIAGGGKGQVCIQVHPSKILIKP